MSWRRLLALFGGSRAVGADAEITSSLNELKSMLKTSVGRLETSVGRLETSVGRLETSVGSLETSVGRLETSVGSLETSVGRLETTVGTLETTVGTLETTVGTLVGQVKGLRKDASRMASSMGSIFEMTCSGTITQQFGASLGAPRALRTVEDVAVVVSPEGPPIVPSATRLVATLQSQDLGFLHLMSCGVQKVQDLAKGKGPTDKVVVAANELQAIGARERLATAAAAATQALEAPVAADSGGPSGAAAAAALAAARVPVEACKAVVRQLHHSTVGRMVYATEMEQYLCSSPEQRAELLAGDMFMPCLSAVATGTPLRKLELDRCGRVSWEDHRSSDLAVLHIGVLNMPSSSVRHARKQVVRSATILAWAYHALRSGGSGAGGGGRVPVLPPVLDVRAHIFTSKDQHSLSRAALKQLLPYHHEERLPGLCCPLTVYLKYYTLTPSIAKRWQV